MCARHVCRHPRWSWLVSQGVLLTSAGQRPRMLLLHTQWDTGELVTMKTTQSPDSSSVDSRSFILPEPFPSTTWIPNFNIYQPHFLIKTDPRDTSQEYTLSIDFSNALFVSLGDPVGPVTEAMTCLLHVHRPCSASTGQIRSLRLSWYRSSLTDTQLAVAKLRLATVG